MVISWARKAQQNGLSLMPVPDDPFALPVRPNSDPVRGPIFIQMDTSCLKPRPPSKAIDCETDGDNNDAAKNEGDDSIFSNFAKSSWEQRTFLFREEIARRFGFVATNVGSTMNAKQQHQNQTSTKTLFSTDHQYIHCTGNMFLLVSYISGKFHGIM